MTTTLNNLPCAEVELHVPRYGAPWARAELTGDATFTDGQRVTLAVAGLTVSATVVDVGSRGGVTTVEMVGGAGGWFREVSASKGYRNDAGVSGANVAKDLASLVGETLANPEALARAMGAHFVRGMGQAAGALLSALGSLPEGSARIPWRVDLDGVTRLGERPQRPSPTADIIDRDALGAWVAFAEEDAAPLLPGTTIEGRAVTLTEIRATPGGTRETVYLDEGERAAAQTVMGELRAWALDLFRSALRPRTLYAYRVTRVAAGDRLDLAPVRARFAAPLEGVRILPGAAGHSARPRVGSIAIVAFVDGDPGQPYVVGFQPLDGSLGKPARVDHDADLVVLAQGTLPTGRGGAKYKLEAIALPSPLLRVTITDPDGGAHVWDTSATVGAAPGPVTFTVIDGTGVTAGEATIDAGRAEVRV